MIPLRVKLRGFLCYKDEQEVSFDGSTLWMLSGLNGSGKSAIFDGVTYALFGHHRGGSTGAHELINKNSDSLEVEFDFLQDGQAFRLHRTLKRKARGGTHATQQIYRRLNTNGTGTGKWEAIQDTTRRTEFGDWIKENIGLSYETFTSSVLLLQGKAEKLLDSTAKGRFEVLAGIVDLDRYRKLHQKADDERRERDASVKSQRERLASLPEISAVEIVQAEAKVEDAEKERGQAWQEVERLQSVEFQAKQWVEVSERLRQTRQKLRQSESLLGDAAKIEQAEKRLKELRLVLPVVKNAMEQQRGMTEAARKKVELLDRQKKIEQELARHDEDLHNAKQARRNQEESLQRDERKLREISGELRSVTTAMEKLRELERHEKNLHLLQKDLTELPSEPARTVRQIRERCDVLGESVQALPLLSHLSKSRADLREALEQEKTAIMEKQKIETHGKQLKTQVEGLKEQCEAAQKHRQQMDNLVMRSRTLMEQADEELRELMLLRGAKTCRHCGQPLTTSHLKDEKVRREKRASEVQTQYKQARTQLKQAQENEQSICKQYDEREQQRQIAREEYRTCLHRAEQAGKDVERLRQECKRIYQDLPVPFRRKIAATLPEDWLTTTYPTANDVELLRRQGEELQAAKQQLREAETTLQKWNQLKAEENSVLQNMQRLQADLPKEHDILRQKHADLEAEEKALEQSVDARRAALMENQKKLDRLSRQRELTNQDLLKYRADINKQQVTEDNCRQVLERAMKELPDDWKQLVSEAGLGDYYTWEQERERLLAENTEDRADQLRQAQALVEGLKSDVQDLATKIDQFPEEARQGPSAVLKMLQQARDKHKLCDEALNQARQSLSLLQHQKQQRREAEQTYLEADKELAHAKLLSELLGRERLQLHLVRQAERQVVDHANMVLDRLSGGELYLRLCGEAGGEGNAAKALELEVHNRVTGEQPINVAFLSGSQKFRVAVSLALGIGQYASRQHRPIESVIIDEGFGCLDKNARQVMIQELQNLRTQMRCILLVSHQEEFADAFTDGYHFELQDGTTVARRFQR